MSQQVIQMVVRIDQYLMEKYYCVSCAKKFGFDYTKIRSRNAHCENCFKFLDYYKVETVHVTVADIETKPMIKPCCVIEGYTKVQVTDLKVGDYVKCVATNCTADEGFFLLADKEYGRIIIGSGMDIGEISWFVNISNTQFFVKDVPKPSSLVDKWISTNVTCLEIGTHIKHVNKEQNKITKGFLISVSEKCVKVGITTHTSFMTAQIDIDDGTFFIKKTTQRTNEQVQVADLEAKLAALQKEKDNVESRLKIFQSSYEKMCKLFQRDLPKDVIAIVDKYKYFDLVSLFRAIYKHDINIPNLNAFASTVEPQRETVIFVEHSFNVVTTLRTQSQTLGLYHEMHLVYVYEQMKAYFEKNEVPMFAIDPANPVNVIDV
jgi:hypothetical protein